ncbi:MAG: hypothetical protein VB025_07475 [Sphaerochaeta sp.]|nr:hypothetical protein [Sphaerochaeta sp.]
MAYINELCADIGPGGLFPLFVSYPIERMSDEQLERVLDEESRNIFLSENNERLLYWPVEIKHA